MEHPRAVLLGSAAAVLACNALAVLQRCLKQAHQPLRGVARRVLNAAPNAAEWVGCGSTATT